MLMDYSFIGLYAKGEKKSFREMAEYIKKEFEKRHKGTWHIIVGKK